MKALLKSIIYILVAFIIFYFSANYVLRKVAVKAVAELRPRLEQKGIIIDNFHYDHLRMISYNSCVIEDIDLNFHLNKKMFGKESFAARFNSGSLIIRFADMKNPCFFFTAKDFYLHIEPEEDSEKKPFGKLANGHATTRIPLYLKHPEESTREILIEIKRLFHENKTPLDLDIDVDVYLGMDDKEVMVNLYTERSEGFTLLKFNDADILKASEQFELDLTEKEAQIISRYPSKVPAMIKITRDAKRISEKEKNSDQTFPEDAYRHVYWSYKLTREFGAGLAKEITNAHETSPENTPRERQMDYHNNDIGRRYADENISVAEIKHRVLNSMDVIRSPNDVR